MDGMIYVADLAKILQADPAWLGALITNLGIPVAPDGTLSSDKLKTKLDYLVRYSVKRGGTVPKVQGLIGSSEESGRQLLIKEFEKHGIRLLHRDEKRGSRFTMKTPRGKKLWVATQVALKSKAHPGQVGFTAGPGRLGDAYDWYAFIAVPFGKIYLQSRKDMKRRWNKNHKNVPMGRMSLTFSVGTDTDLLENRINELLGK